MNSLLSNPFINHQAAIDFDQSVIATQIGLKTEGSFKLAQVVYQQDGNSKSYAEITLDEELGSALTKGTAMDIGTTYNGKACDSYSQEIKTIRFKYDISKSYKENVVCKVGGLPVDGRTTNSVIT